MPDLGVEGVPAKLDTGSRSSVIHADDIAIDGDRARFVLSGGPEGATRVPCTAAVADRRRVTSSNGQSELRVFIRTALAIGDLPPREVELSLTARPLMQYPLLVGRRALAAWQVLVDPNDDSGGAVR